jgi:hypothetical protein
MLADRRGDPVDIVVSQPRVDRNAERPSREVASHLGRGDDPLEGREVRDGALVVRPGLEPGVVALHELGGTQGPEQSTRWARAFHAYLFRRHGATYARVCSILAAIGLGLRAVAYLPKRRALGLRLARAARAVADVAVGRRATTVLPE